MNWIRARASTFRRIDFGDLRIFRQRLRSLCLLATGGGVWFCIASATNGHDWVYNAAIMPLLRRLDPETAHTSAIWAAKHGITPLCRYEDPILNTRVLGMQFSSPVGLAAGFDKHAEACLGLQRLGFGFIEVGSVTPLPQPGNEKPRVFRLPLDSAIINRYGFNSDGHQVVYERLTELRDSCARGEHKMTAPIGVNLGKNKMATDAAEDFAAGVRLFGNLANYLVINVSSPNTPGLRALQHGEDLPVLLERVLAARDSLKRPPPLLLKISPDLTSQQKRHVAACALRHKGRLAGLVVCNSTVERPVSLVSDMSVCVEPGGLSGPPLNQMSTRTISDMYRLTNGELVIIGVGGVSCGRDAYAKIRAGASLVQLYTALTVQGPPVVSRVKRELAALLREDGYSSVAEAVGADHKKNS